jgi:hypothetical protein
MIEGSGCERRRVGIQNECQRPRGNVSVYGPERGGETTLRIGNAGGQ